VAEIRIGTCSWADEALSQLWYPKGVSPRARLAYYAERFDTVEVDSTYYRIPTAEMVAGWAERTPPGFVMHVKAFGVMTRHPVKLDQLPPELREGMPVDDRGRVDRPSREARGRVFDAFLEALEPLRDARKLGGILFQFPSYVVWKDRSLDYLRWARERLGDGMLVEFRHASWLDDEHRADTLAFLESLPATHVVTDSPRIEDARNLVATVPALTSGTAYVRFHGRNAGTWNKRGGSAAERFDYLYGEDELREWVRPLAELAEGAEEAYVFFNNNGRSPSAGDDGHWVAQAPTNAEMLRTLLREAGVPVSAPSS
jgi:uncharacterized protein YecE (DUF72 family)